MHPFQVIAFDFLCSNQFTFVPEPNLCQPGFFIWNHSQFNLFIIKLVIPRSSAAGLPYVSSPLEGEGRVRGKKIIPHPYPVACYMVLD